MRKTPLGLAKFGALPTLALIAAAMPSAAQAQIRNRVPSVSTPAQTPATIRRRTPATEVNCPDPIQARRDGRTVPAGCPGAQEEQAPVAVQYREQPGESRPVSTRRAPTVETPLADQPVNDGRVRRRAPVANTPADGEMQDSIPNRPPPIRSRGDSVAQTPDEVAPPREITPDRPPPIRRRGDSVAQTPDEVAPPREITPDRPPPIRRRGDSVAQTPDDAPTEATPVRPRPVRRSDDYVATTPDEGIGRARQRPQQEPVAVEPVRPVRPIRPTSDGNFPTVPAGGVGGQLQCIVPRPDSQLFVSATTVTRMICGFPGPNQIMEFRMTAHQYGQVVAAYKNGHAARVTFSTEMDGKYHIVIDVSEGMQAMAKAVCVPIEASYHSNLTVKPRGQNWSSTWCTTDGKTVFPIDVAPFDNSVSGALYAQQVEDGPLELSYFHVTTPYTLDVASVLPRYPQYGTTQAGTTATSDQAKVDGQEQWMGIMRLTYAEPPLTGPVYTCWGDDKVVAKGTCQGLRWKYQGENIVIGDTVDYRAYASPAVINAASRPAASNQRKSVVYTLMPGIIPVQYRAKAGGACRVLIGVEVTFTKIGGGAVGVGRSDDVPPPLDPGETRGTSSGVTPAPKVVKAPLQDNCAAY